MSIVLLIPYFGKLPNYLPAFLHSCPKNPEILFYFFTDDESILKQNLSSNIIVKITSFDAINEKVMKLGFDRMLSAYKLCDCKPLYGQIFKEEIKGFDFWGYCDIDLMFGDISKFLNEIKYSDYDRIGRFGHFTLYRNTAKINRLYMYSSSSIPISNLFPHIGKTTYPCNFDEMGMNIICREEGIKFYDQDLSVQPTIGLDYHLHSWTNSKFPQLFVWDNGHIFVYTKKMEIEKKEFAYFHFIDRKDLPIREPLGEKVLVTHLGFYRFDESKLEELFLRFGMPDTEEESASYLRKVYKDKIKRRVKRALTELKQYKLKGLYNIYQRYRGVRWIYKNNLQD